MTNRPLSVGISTCPNDTFAFHALIAGETDPGPFRWNFEFLDVQELNERLFRGDFDIAKASFHAALQLTAETTVLESGSALGFGVGPLLLSRSSEHQSPAAGARVLCPGEHTTATLLYRLFHPSAPEPEQVVFSDIMPALEAGSADYGVCIHEGRFTYKESGLHFVEDLGKTWEEHFGTGLPLGGLLARRELGPDLLARAQEAIAASIRFGLEHREATLPTMQRHAQELGAEVCFQHVDLYVNARTQALGAEGREALDRLFQAGREIGQLEPDAPALDVMLERDQSETRP
ncbi:MAG: 1,4-dihydroxy-6-naphthoate synthase [Planctomycetota bacterium]